jgi:hypothetical protein
VKTIEDEVVTDPYTVARRTARECAEGMYRAAVNPREGMRRTVAMMDEIRAAAT